MSEVSFKLNKYIEFLTESKNKLQAFLDKHEKFVKEEKRQFSESSSYYHKHYHDFVLAEEIVKKYKQLEKDFIEEGTTHKEVTVNNGFLLWKRIETIRVVDTVPVISTKEEERLLKEATEFVVNGDNFLSCWVGFVMVMYHFGDKKGDDYSLVHTGINHSASFLGFLQKDPIVEKYNNFFIKLRTLTVKLNDLNGISPIDNKDNEAIITLNDEEVSLVNEINGLLKEGSV